ncbi:MAG: DUF4065 domain-containing protein [Bacteroidales bacterium]|nr:DUF4065 domain-containing protein [Bacteroidales bacterium]
MAYKSLDIAKTLILMAQEDGGRGGEWLTNLKLQKLLYYAQGYHLAALGTLLFEDAIEAWMYGPVVPVCYEHYQKYGSKSLPMLQGKSYGRLDEIDDRLLRQVYNSLVAYSAIGLMQMTHTESPWLDTNPKGHGTIISTTKMKDYFKPKYPTLVRASFAKTLDSFVAKNEDSEYSPSDMSIKRCLSVLAIMPDAVLPYIDLTPNEFGSINISIRIGNARRMTINTGDETMSWYYCSDDNSRPCGKSFVGYNDMSFSEIIQTAKKLVV